MKPSIRTLATATMMAATALAGMTVVAAAADKVFFPAAPERTAKDG